MIKKVGILTGGGDVPPLNTVIETLRINCKKNNINLIGFKKGWQGILNEDFVGLTEISIPSKIGGTYLKSSRINLAKLENGTNKAEEILKKLEIEALVVIGGEDTISNSLLIKDIPQIIVSKTIDNDVGLISQNEITNYFTLGHPTAAEKISSYVSLNEGLRTTAYSHERLIVVESMGMHAGWLALSSALGRPDYIVIPEYPIDYNLFIEKISQKYKEQKHLILVVAEGAMWSNGKYISADNNETDEFGHPRFKGAASIIAERLKKDLKKEFDTRNVNFVNPSYLYRSGKPNNLDYNASIQIGQKASELIQIGINSTVFLSMQFNGKEFFPEVIPFQNIDNIEKFYRKIPPQFYDQDKLSATNAYLNYIEKIAKSFPNNNYGFH